MEELVNYMYLYPIKEVQIGLVDFTEDGRSFFENNRKLPVPFVKDSDVQWGVSFCT